MMRTNNVRLSICFFTITLFVSQFFYGGAPSPAHLSDASQTEVSISERTEGKPVVTYKILLRQSAQNLLYLLCEQVSYYLQYVNVSVRAQFLDRCLISASLDVIQNAFISHLYFSSLPQYHI
jgi:hypothetical protein